MGCRFRVALACLRYTRGHEPHRILLKTALKQSCFQGTFCLRFATYAALYYYLVALPKTLSMYITVYPDEKALRSRGSMPRAR